MKNPYEILGVSKTAKPQEIKSAFRKLAKQYHPDYRKDDPKAKEKFAEINQAYEILGDEKKRARFDRNEIDANGNPIHHGFSRGQTYSETRNNPFGRGDFDFSSAGGFDPGDFFRDLFGGRSSAREKAAPPKKGADIKSRLTVSLEQLVQSDKLEVSFSSGKKLKIKLPDYVEEGQVIRLKGQGEASRGGVNGDALISLHIAKHPRFKLEGRAVHLDLPINLKDAVLGTKLRVDTLDGEVMLNVPAWTNSGRVLRLKGKGLPTKAAGRDDMYVHIQIILPEEKRKALTEFFEKDT